jgi:hypothetical protein
LGNYEILVEKNLKEEFKESCKKLIDLFTKLHTLKDHNKRAEVYREVTKELESMESIAKKVLDHIKDLEGKFNNVLKASRKRAEDCKNGKTASKKKFFFLW